MERIFRVHHFARQAFRSLGRNLDPRIAPKVMRFVSNVHEFANSSPGAKAASLRRVLSPSNLGFNFAFRLNSL
jgi:hypothetical protein